MNADHLTTLPGRAILWPIPHLRGDGEQVPLTRYALELVRAALVELQP